MNKEECLTRMVPPSQTRLLPPQFHGGVMQIHITRACDMSCFGCTQGSNLRGKPVLIGLDEFEQACKSLKNPNYWGVVGVFGGNPAMHPKFPEICEILRGYFPYEQRGLWCNHPLGHGKVMSETFNPLTSNLNVHLNQEAFSEFKRDWPGSLPFGLYEDSRHSPPFVAMLDVIQDEGERWKLISGCDLNKNWSAMICAVPNHGLRAFFCEIAGAQAMLHANDPNWPDTGLPAVEGWWVEPMEAFEKQVEWNCHRCGVPLKRYGELATRGSFEEVSKTHASIYQPKVKNREVKLVELDSGPKLGRFTDYIGNSAR